MTLEEDVARHYTTGTLLSRIEAALKVEGADPDHLTVDDLKPVDEFHTGGIEATSALLDQLDIDPQMTVLDIGAGLGGTARHIVHRYGARVLGVDLTPDFVNAGRTLTEMVHLQERITLDIGSALDLPHEDATVDLAVMFHVGMNVADKDMLFTEVARVLRPKGRFALFDVMRGENQSDLVYPLPWSGTETTSHVDAPGVYRRAGHAAGLTHLAERDRTAFAQDYFDRVSRKIAAAGPPPLGIHLLMGEDAGTKIENYVANLTTGRIAPHEMIFEKPG
ncbi:MAG: class I SAM-dependent methyltransferase [Pseudomonadota bacterium]